ncbi:MAG: polysaccharide biosynthesis tyrosine autokinase [Deltaproteobacteria bacterium]|nr:polysaccharide biosynthesis tyrosine autokinase [Deltaproteobacteria bacterium]
MSFFLKKNHYESLGVGINASPEEIEQAYERSRRLYSDDSEAVYALYSDEERQDRLSALDGAYAVLSDLELKKEYDKSLSTGASEDGTYEVDLNYIFAGEKRELHEQPETARANRYGSRRQASIIKPIAALEKSEAMAAEQFKLLSSKLEQASRKTGQKVVAFTSAIKGEGKSAVSLNAALMLAAAFGKNVAFVECDLRKPSSVLEYLAAEGPGLAEVLRGESTLEDAICTVEGTGLHVISAGSYDKNVADLIGSAGTVNIIKSLRQRFDLVILDCPPVIPLADMSIIEKLVDSIVFIVRAGSTSRQLVKNAIDSLDRKKFFGAVLNGAETKLEKYYY